MSLDEEEHLLPDYVDVVCVSWDVVKNMNCRHFDQISTVSIVDGNGDTVLGMLERKYCRFIVIMQKVKLAIRGKLLIGYNLRKFLRLMKLDHPVRMTKDVLQCGHFVERFFSRKSLPSLGELLSEVLNVEVFWKAGYGGNVKIARIVLDLWNLMQGQGNSDERGRLHVARFLIRGTKEVLELLNRKIKLIRMAGRNPVGISTCRLNEDFYERILSIHFTHVDDFAKVLDRMMRDLGGEFRAMRLLLHRDMSKHVQGRACVYLSLYRSRVSVFPLSAPGSAEHVVLLEGERQGIVKTLEMIMQMQMQLEEDTKQQFYAFHRDFYDAANAYPVTPEKYGGFGKRSTPQTSPSSSPTKIVKGVQKPLKLPSKTQHNQLSRGLTPSSDLVCVKAKLCTDDLEKQLDTLLVSPPPSIARGVEPPLPRGGGGGGALCPVDTSRARYLSQSEIEDESKVAQNLNEISNPCYDISGQSGQFLEEVVQLGVAHDAPASSETDEPMVSVEMTVSKAVAELVICRKDSLASLGASVEIGEANMNTEVVISISGSKEKARRVYIEIQSFVESIDSC